MKQHSGAFCSAKEAGLVTTSKRSELDNPKPRAAPRARMVLSEDRTADREYLVACRRLKKLSEDDFSRFGAHHTAPHCFAPFATCLVALCTDTISSAQASWATLAPLLCPSPAALLAELFTLDLASLPPAAQRALQSLPPLEVLHHADLEKASPAALALAKWCCALQSYHLFVSATGFAPVSPGVSRTVKRLCERSTSPSKAFAFSTFSMRGGSTCRSPSARHSKRSSSVTASRPRTPSARLPSTTESRQRQQQRDSRVVPANTPPVVHQHAPPLTDTYHSVRDWLVAIGLAAFTTILLDNEIDIEV